MEYARGTIRVGGVGSLTFTVSGSNVRALGRISDRELAQIIQGSADTLVQRTRAAAPVKTGAIRSGIIRSPGPERSSKIGKVVYDLYVDPAMNDTFVKYTKSGKRYYYPASMEYGFRLKRGRRYPGKYYMRNSAVAYSDDHTQRVAEGIGKIMEGL